MESETLDNSLVALVTKGVFSFFAGHIAAINIAQSVFDPDFSARCSTSIGVGERGRLEMGIKNEKYATASPGLDHWR
jgi:hypothetical protein